MYKNQRFVLRGDRSRGGVIMEFRGAASVLVKFDDTGMNTLMRCDIEIISELKQKFQAGDMIRYLAERPDGTTAYNTYEVFERGNVLWTRSIDTPTPGREHPAWELSYMEHVPRLLDSAHWQAPCGCVVTVRGVEVTSNVEPERCADFCKPGHMRGATDACREWLAAQKPAERPIAVGDVVEVSRPDDWNGAQLRVSGFYTSPKEGACANGQLTRGHNRFHDGTTVGFPVAHLRRIDPPQSEPREGDTWTSPTCGCVLHQCRTRTNGRLGWCHRSQGPVCPQVTGHGDTLRAERIASLERPAGIVSPAAAEVYAERARSGSVPATLPFGAPQWHTFATSCEELKRELNELLRKTQGSMHATSAPPRIFAAILAQPCSACGVRLDDPYHDASHRERALLSPQSVAWPLDERISDVAHRIAMRESDELWKQRMREKYGRNAPQDLDPDEGGW